MNYRILGRTGLKVSEIALGCEGFLDKTPQQANQLFGLAAENGVNCMDLYSPNPQLHRFVGSALQGQREKFILQAHLCTVWKNGQYQRTRQMDEVQSSFEALLKNLQTDYLDIGMIHYVDSPSEWETIANGPIMQYAQQQKAAGRIRYIGLSSHNPKAALPAVESGLVDVLMFSVNPCYDLQPGSEDLDALFAPESYAAPLLNLDPEREQLYETCQRLGVGITVMKAFGGGDLLNQALSPAGRSLSVLQCLHYALSRPAVACVMAGAHTTAELAACLAYETASEQEKDYASALAAFPRMSWKGHCMYCGHCAPCPKGIDVAAVTKFLNLARAATKLPETVREHYAVLAHTASECSGCGACEARCPFEVPVRQNMQLASQVFGR